MKAIIGSHLYQSKNTSKDNWHVIFDHSSFEYYLIANMRIMNPHGWIPTYRNNECH